MHLVTKALGFTGVNVHWGKQPEAIPCGVFSPIPSQQGCADRPTPSFVTRVTFEILIRKEQALLEQFLQEILQAHKI